MALVFSEKCSSQGDLSVIDLFYSLNEHIMVLSLHRYIYEVLKKGFFMTLSKSTLIPFLLGGALVASLSTLYTVYSNSGCCSGFFAGSSQGHPDMKSFLAGDHKDRIYIPIAIVGTGPSGSSAAVYGARSMMRTVALQGPRPGGLLTMTSDVENWPGVKKNKGEAIMQNIAEQAQHFGALFLDETIKSIDFGSWPYKITTDMDKVYYAFTIVVATGANPILLGLESEKHFFGRGVGTCALCDAAFYKGKEVAVVGGGDSAVEEAIQLATYATKVTILVRKEKMRAAESMQHMLKDYPHIDVKYNIEVQEVLGDDEAGVTGLRLLDNGTNKTTDFKVDGMFLAIGHEPSTALFNGKLTMDEKGYLILQGRTQQTSVTGVFAGGDCHDHRYRQAVTASGFGAAAGIDAVNYLKEIGFNAQVQQALADHIYTPDSEVAAVEDAVVAVSSLEEFNKVIEGDKPVFVDFWADYCPSCKQMLPGYHEAAKELKDKVTCVSVDLEQAPEIVARYEVKKVPSFLVFVNGSIVARFAKTLTQKELIDLAHTYIS